MHSAIAATALMASGLVTGYVATEHAVVGLSLVLKEFITVDAAAEINTGEMARTGPGRPHKPAQVHLTCV